MHRAIFAGSRLVNVTLARASFRAPGVVSAFGDKSLKVDIKRSYYNKQNNQEQPGEKAGESSQHGENMDRTDMFIGIGAITAALGGGYLIYKKATKPNTSTELALLSKNTVPVKEEPPKVTSLIPELPSRPEVDPHAKFSVKPGVKLPEKVPYLLVGAGTASFAALRAIRSREPNARVLVLGEEHTPPYMRPPLSKEFWFEDPDHAAGFRTFKQWNGKERSAFFEPDEYYLPYEDLMDSPNGGVSLVTGVKVTKIDSENRKAYLEDGTAIIYKKCLLAPGCKPKTLPVLEKASAKNSEVKKRWMVFRDMEDFQYLVQVMKSVRSVAIVGGGFLGSELACALGKVGSSLGVNVTQIFKEDGNLRGVLPGYLSQWSTKKVEECGVSVLRNTEIVEAKMHKTSDRHGDSKELHLKLNNGETLPVDFVVTCVGVEPNIGIGRASNLEVDDQFGGFIVNSEFMARTNLWVAGDASCFFDPLLGRRRVEHHDHAVVSGRLAGENMTGASKNYKHQSMIWSDLGPEIGFEAVGLVDARLPTFGVFAKQSKPGTTLKAKLNTNMRSEAEEGILGSALGSGKITWPQGQPMHLKPHHHEDINASLTPADIMNAAEAEKLDMTSPEFKKGVVFYTKDDRVVGIVLWNIFSRMPLARRVLQEGITTEEIPEVAKLFEIHDKDQIEV